MGSLKHIVTLICVCVPLPALAQPIPDWTIDELEAAIANGELGKVRAAAVEQAGSLTYRKRFDGMEMGSPVDIKSAGKSITAIVVGMAIDDGFLTGVEQKVWPLLGSRRTDAASQVSIGDLLSMSSALDCNDWERRSPGQEEKMYAKRDWREFALNLPLRDRGDRDDFSYCTAGVFLLGQAVQEASGERFDRYVQRRLFDPLGIQGVEWRRSRSGEVQSGGQLTISDGALLKIGRLVMSGGEWEGKQLVSEDWLRAMLAPRHQMGEHVHYSRLWWLTPLRSSSGYVGAFMMKGNGGNIVALVPAYDAVLVVQTENYNQREAERNSFVVLTSMLGSLDAPSGGPPAQ
ncbi:6-aminohexanoate-oligomer exohydrolase [Altererythrobacter insulae]|nr:6-aminohexanoate-oligomer exohydrolase [Altererythrobacter insulae]